MFARCSFSLSPSLSLFSLSLPFLPSSLSCCSYGDISAFNPSGPNQNKLRNRGDEYVAKEFSKLDKFLKCTITGGGGETGGKEGGGGRKTRGVGGGGGGGVKTMEPLEGRGLPPLAPPLAPKLLAVVEGEAGGGGFDP